MKLSFFNVVWQTLKTEKPKGKKKSKTWSLIKMFIEISACVWKILKFFFDESDDS